jgi:hypothetical protein
LALRRGSRVAAPVVPAPGGPAPKEVA